MSARFSLNLSTHSSLFIQITQVNLTAADIFTLYIGNRPGTSEPILHIGRIWGKESRNMADFGFLRSYDLETPNLRWFYEVAFNVTNTTVRENAIQIENFKQSIIDRGTYMPGQGFSSIAAHQSAFGIGLVGSLGLRYVINNNASLDIGLTTYLQDINLEGYKKFHQNFNLFARLNFLTL